MNNENSEWLIEDGNKESEILYYVSAAITEDFVFFDDEVWNDVQIIFVSLKNGAEMKVMKKCLRVGNSNLCVCNFLHHQLKKRKSYFCFSSAQN